MSAAWIPWAPPWAPHITGRYTERVWDPEARMHEEQLVEMQCNYPDCGASWQTRCASGQVRAHIQQFATVHRHIVSASNPHGVDPLAAPRIVRPTSLRAEEIAKRQGR